MVPSPMGRATNHEIAVAMAGRDFPGLRVFLACGYDSRGVGQRAPIDAGTDTHRERLWDVINRLVGFVHELDLKNQGILGIEPKDLRKNDVESFVERFGECSALSIWETISGYCSASNGYAFALSSKPSNRDGPTLG